MRKKDFAKRGLSVLMAVAMTFSNMGSLPNAFASESATVFETEMEETETVSVGEPQIETVKVEEPAAEERSGFDGATENSGADTDVETVEVAVDETTETYSVAIDIGTLNGTVTASSDAFGGRTAVLEKNEEGEFISKVTGTDGSVTETVLDEENPFALILKAQAGSTVHVKAEADDGYVVGLYTVENGDGEKEGTAFKEDAYSAFEYDVVADADKIVTVYFTEADEDIEVESESVAETEEETKQSEIGSEAEDIPAIEETEEAEETEAVSETESDFVETESEAIESEIESEIETETEIETESETETEIETETESESESETEETEHFLEKAEGVEKLNADDFSSMRLVVMTADEENIIDEEHLIAAYDTIYLLQYGSIEQTMNAFVYYEKNADAVEPDKTIGVASEESDSEEANIVFSDEQNPILAISDEVPLTEATEAVEVETPHVGGLIALIDTGASGGNVVGQVSLIDDAMSGNGHGDAMVSAIASIDPAATIFSIRAMDDTGHGTISSVVAAIEYAINSGANIINLSMYAKKSLLNSVLEQEIQKAVSAGIIVVGAAGNDGSDASLYMPGAVSSAYIIGACDEKGQKIPSSNYGATVDYNVVADTTSEAAAKFTGYVSQNSLYYLDRDVNNNGLIFSTDYVYEEKELDPNVKLVLKFDFYDYAESNIYEQNGLAVATDYVYSLLEDEDDDYYYFYTNAFNDVAPDTYRPHTVQGMINGNGNGVHLDESDDVFFDSDENILKVGKKTYDKYDYIQFGVSTLNTTTAYAYLVPADFKIEDTPAEFMTAGLSTSPDSSHFNGGCGGNHQTPYHDLGTKKDPYIKELKAGSIIGITGGDGSGALWLSVSSAKYATNCGKATGKACNWLKGRWSSQCIDHSCNPNASSDTSTWTWNGSTSSSHAYVTSTSKKKSGNKVIYTVNLNVGIRKGGGEQNQGIRVSVKYEEIVDMDVQMKKTVDSSYVAITKGNPLYGSLAATYAVYNKKTKKHVGDLKTNADGQPSNTLKLSPGDYYMVETAAPPNYALDSKKIPFTVKDKNLTGKNALSASDTPSITEGKAMTKVDPRTKDASYKGPIGSQDMSRSSFTLEYWAAKNSTAGNPTATWIFRPDSLGHMDFSNPGFKVSGNYIQTKNGRGIFPIGTYRLSETNPAEGFNGLFTITGQVVQIGTSANAEWKWNAASDYIEDSNLIVENNPLYAPVDVKKAVKDSIVPQGDITLEGIKFGVYNKSDLPIVDLNKVVYNPEDEIESVKLVTDANGNATSPAILPIGTYEIKEIETNEGLKKTVDYLKTVTIAEEGTYPNKKIVKTETGPDGYTPLQDTTAYNEPVRGGISVPKIDELLGRAHDHGDTDLSGAEFTIVNASKAFVLKKDRKTRVETAPSLKGKKKEEVNYAQIKAAIDADKNCVAAVITTDKTGHASTASDELVYGTYFIIETAPPTKGYHLNTTWYDRIEVRKDGEIYSTTEVADLIYRGGARIKKFDYMRDTDKDHGDADLSGAEFLIVNASLDLSMNEAKTEVQTSGIKNDHPTYAQVKAAAEKSTMQKLITDKAGFAQTSDQALPYGTYYVIETKAPEGYLLNEKWVGRYVVREDKVMYDPEVVEKGMHDESNHPDNDQHDLSGDALLNLEGHEYAVNDQIVRGGILIPKYDKELDSATPQGIASLRLAEFTIINASKASVRNKDGKDVQTAKGALPDSPTWSQVKAAINDDNVVQVITTNSEGVAKTGKKDLPYGTYYVIETKASYGYYLDDSFVGKIVIRDDGAFMALDGSVGNSSFKELHERVPDRKETVDQQPRRGDITFRKTNIDGRDKAYIPFLISAVKIDEETGLESVLEQHVVFATKTGYVNTASKYRKHSYHTNEADQYVKNEVLTDAGEEILAKLKAGESDADTWGIWFEGNSNDAPKTSLNDDFGALYPCYYTITEVKCSDNADYAENLMNLPMVRVYNNDDDPSKPEGNLYAPMVTNASNWDETNYFVIVDTEIKVESLALDLESRSKTLPVREAVAIRDTVNLQHVSSDHDYRITTKFVDVTDGMRELKIVGTDDPDATISPDGVWVQKEFRPEKISGTNSTNATVSLSGKVNTIGREGHRIMAVDYVYEYAPVSEEDNVRYDWHLVKSHPDTSDQKQVDAQSVYVPDLKTTARDVLTQSRVGAKSADDAIYDIVQCYNLSENQVYTLRMKLVDAETGAEMGSGEVGIDSQLGIIWQPKDSGDPSDEMRVYDCSEIMKPYAIDSSNFKDNQAVVVIESLYRANGRTGEPIGEPIVVHDSLLDEKETIRYVDVCTSASDGNTADDVGTSEEAATVYDNVKLSNLVFDDSDDPTYSYTIKGRLIYQKDFTDADGVSHKAGDEVETLDGTKNVVTVTSDAAGNAVCTYEDGSLANWNLDSHRYGFNVAKRAGGAAGDNSYVEDNTAGIVDMTVEMIYKVNSTKLEGGTVVVYEYLYHDATGANEVEVAKHEDIKDKGQTVHYPHVRTSAADGATKDDVGAEIKEASIVDTVKLWNLVPGRTYVVSGKLVEQNEGTNEDPVDFLVNGKPVVQEASITVTEDGNIVSGNGEKTTVTNYDADLNEVDGTVDLTFTFDATELQDRTCVVFEDLYHNGVKVAVHNDLRDEGQTIHFPKIRTHANDGYTGDRVATVTGDAVIVDTVDYVNLVPGREYTLNGVLMRQDNGEPLIDSAGKEVTASRTFTAGETGDGIVVSELDEELNKVSGTVDITFKFDASLLEDTTTVAFEYLEHNKIDVTTHTEITDKPQSDHFPKLRTSAFDKEVGDEVGKVDKTTIVDTVRFWNLIPGMTYEISGTLMDKDTELPFEENGQVVTQKVTFTVPMNDDSETFDAVDSAGNHTEARITRYSEELERIDGNVDLTYEIDASNLEGKTLVVFEDLLHNKVKVTTHADITDLAQTIHFPKLRTTAVDDRTGDDAGTVTETATIIDTVKYFNLVIGKKYEIKGTLMNQETGLPIIGSDGKPVTAEASFVATRESSELNKVTNVNEDNYVVDGEYVIKFTLDSTLLAGKTVVVFEDLYHNEVKVTSHADITDEEQSIHYPEIRTTAFDVNTNDHVGTIWGSFINGVRRLLGQKNEDGSEIEDVRLARITDTVELDNLVPGLTYVVSGKLYNVDESKEQGENVPLLIDGQEIVQAVTITVTSDGRIEALDGSRTTVTKFDAEKHSVDGTVDLVYSLDSSKIQGTELVVFEKLYQDVSYTSMTEPTSVEEEDVIHKHEDVDDKGQSVSEVGIRTTAVDIKTGNHVGSEPGAAGDGPSIIKDEVNLSRLVPGMEYEIEGVLVDIDASDFENEKAMYLKSDGTLTADRAEAYKETLKFTADGEDEVKELFFSIASDKVQGKTLTVFEDLLHAGVVVSSHPAGDGDGWAEEDFAAQTVYYPTGKTNATDNATGVHSSFAEENRVVTDRVYFENLLVGENYEISGQLVYAEDFVGADGTAHSAGEPVTGETRTVKFTASEDLSEAQYDGSAFEVEGMSPTAIVDSLTTKTCANGQKTISGYVSIEFAVNAANLAGATLVAFEEFSNNGVPVFVHKNLKDLPQTVKIPAIRTRARSLDLDEAAVFDENGEYRDIEIIDTVEYRNLWTAEELAEMTEQGKDIRYEDGTAMGHSSAIYLISESAGYVLKGVLMDKETGEPLKNSAGEIYETYSEPFVPETPNGTHEVKFIVNAGDFVDDDDESALEGKTAVVFEDLFIANGPEDADDSTHVAEHHDIDDEEQDIRFPKGRTHATDAVSNNGGAHDEENSTTSHEALASENVVINDLVSFENLHGGTKYEVTGRLQVITGYDEFGVPNAWEAAKDDTGNEITATATLDTSSISEDFNASVSGQILITFTFSGKNLAGKTTVAFETFEREGVPVMVHADVSDEAQTVFLPKIHTNASDAISGLDEAFAGAGTVILDKVTYENLEAGKVYKLRAVLHKKSDGTEIEGTEVEGTFTAGVENQFILRSGTVVGTIDEIRSMISSENVSKETPVGGEYALNPTAGSMSSRASGEVCVLIPVDASSLEGDAVVAFETLWAQEDEDAWKEIAEHEDIDDEDQTVKIPRIRTKAAIDGAKSVVAGKTSTVVDTVEYKNLTPGHKYVIKGELVNKADGKRTEVKADTEFVPKSPNGTAEVKFTFDSSKFAGCQLVVFEELESYSDNYDTDTFSNDSEKTWKVAEHKDIEDEAQTVTIEKPNNPGQPTEKIQTGDVFRMTLLFAALIALALLALLQVQKKKRRMI